MPQPIYPLIALAALLTLGGCQSDPTAEIKKPEEERAIGFGSRAASWQAENKTRATSEEGLEKVAQDFRVWGYKTTGGSYTEGFTSQQTVMDGYRVDYEQATGGWAYEGVYNSSLQTNQGIKYWDYAATSYRFLALAPYSADRQPTLSADQTANTLNFDYRFGSQAEAKQVQYYSDVWASDNHGNRFNGQTACPKYNEQVKLTFQPLMCRVRMRFIYPDNITRVKITDIAFHDARWDTKHAAEATTPCQGQVSLSFPSALQAGCSSLTPTLQWTDLQKGQMVMDTPYEDETDKVHVLADPAKWGTWYYVPPMDQIPDYTDNGTPDDLTDDGYVGTPPYKQGAYTLTLRINGQVKTATVPAELTQWKLGHAYTYIFKITEIGIVFDHVLEVYARWQAGVSGNTEW